MIYRDKINQIKSNQIHDVPTHTSLKTTELVTNKNMVIVPHPSYSPDLVPLWFHFVSQMENGTEGTMFWNSIWHPKGITSGTFIKENDFHIAFQVWKKWWNHCVSSQRDCLKEMAAKIG
jgi:hypothetical protein